MAARNPIKDQVAIIGYGSTGCRRDGRPRSRTALTLEACTAAVRDAGLSPSDIDGVSGTVTPAPFVVSALGLADITHHRTLPPPFGFSLMDAAHAIFAGACDTVLAYHSVYRSPAVSRSVAGDPFRCRAEPFTGELQGGDPEHGEGAVAYSVWASRYLAEYGARREHFGYVALSARAHAAKNPGAVLRQPLSMDEYLASRMIRDPLCLYDMDVPVDCADAFVLTRAERARDLPNVPVLIHAMSSGITAPVEEMQAPGFHRHGQRVVAADLLAKSDVSLAEFDVYFPYDGFTFLTLTWLESMGWCKPGEAGPFIESNLDADGRLAIGGRTPVNPHGGNLSEGATTGAGQIREAVIQLRGAAGDRQRLGATTALLTLGGLFFNAQGLVLTTP